MPTALGTAEVSPSRRRRSSILVLRIKSANPTSELFNPLFFIHDSIPFLYLVHRTPLNLTIIAPVHSTVIRVDARAQQFSKGRLTFALDLQHVVTYCDHIKV